MNNKYIISRDINGKEYKEDIKTLSWRPSVYGVLIENNKVLLLKQFGDGYDFPGGGIELHENIEEALIREYWEETGLEIKVRELITCESNFHRFRSLDISKNCILIYYVCEKIGGQLSKDNFDDWEKKNCDLAEWIDIDKIDSLKFYNKVNSVGIIRKAAEIIGKR